MIKEKISYEELEKNVEFLTAQLNQRTEEIAVINGVQQGLAKKMDMQVIYDLVGDRVQKLFNSQAVIIASFDIPNNTEYFNYTFENGEKVKIDARPINKLRQSLIDKRQTIYIRTQKQATSEYGITAIANTGMPKSLLFVPLMAGSDIRGYVSLQNIDAENAFSDSDIRLLETIANSMSVALENARLFDETNRLLKETEQGKAELAVINSVQEGLVREIDIQGIYNLVGNRIRELFNAQAVIIATFDHEKKLEHFNYAIEKGEITSLKPRPFDKVRQHLIQTGQNILINENFVKAAAEFGMKVLPGTEAPKSLLFMPMKVGDKVTGYVSLQNIDQENAFSFSDVRLLSTLANSMSVALQNAKLFDETNRLLKQTEQQKIELAVINSVQEGLAKALNMQAIYDLVGNRIRELFDAQVVGIATFDHKIETEHIHYLIEKGERYYPAPRPLNILRKHLIETKQKVLINKNFEEVAAAFGMKKVPGTEQPKSALYVPLVIGEKVTGYTSLQNVDKENAFSESDVRLLETLANTMGVALENARLFDETTRLLKETEQQKAELGVINSVQEGLAKELDMQAIYDLVGNRIQELFNAQAVIIATFDHDTAIEHFKYAIEDGQRFKLSPRPYYKLRQHLIVSRQKIVINTNYGEAYAKFGMRTLPGTSLTKSGVFVPLFDPVVASGLGLRFVEKSVKKDLYYLYTILPTGQKLNMRTDTGRTLVNGLDQYIRNSFPTVTAASGDKIIKLRWTTNFPLQTFSGYIIERSDDGKNFKQINRLPFVFFNSAKGATSPIEYSDSVFQDYKKYYYRVTGINAFGDHSYPSAILIAQAVDLTPPAAPVIDSIKNQAEGKIKLQWIKKEKESDFKGYVIGRSANLKGPFIPISQDFLPYNTTCFTDEHPETVAPNYYIVAAVDTAGNAGRSMPAYMNVEDKTPPSSPTGLAGNIDSSGRVFIHWSWGKEPDLAGYKILFSNSPNHVFTPAYGNLLTDTVFTDSITLKTLSKRIYYKVVAFDRSMNESTSSAILTLTKPGIIPPMAPIIHDFLVSDSGVNIKWHKSSSEDAAQQLLYRKKDSSSWSVLSKLNKEDTSYTDTQVIQKHSYTYSIETIDSSGLSSGKSFPLKVYVYSKNKTIENFQAKKSQSANKIMLSWNPQTQDVSFYILYVNKDKEGFKLEESIPGKNVSYEQQENSGNYQFAIKAIYKNGEQSTLSTAETIPVQ